MATLSPNIRCAPKLEWSAGDTEQIAALGPTIQALSLSWAEAHDLSISTQYCSNMKKICLIQENNVVDTIKQLLLFDKPLLTSFLLDMSQYANDSPDDALQELGVCAGKLLTFSYTGHIPSMGALHRFCLKAEQLKTAELHLDRFTDGIQHYESLVAEIIGSFLACPNLRELAVFNASSNWPNPEHTQSERVEAVKDLCFFLRHKRSDLSAEVLGVNYTE